MKLKQIKVYSFNRTHIDNGIINSANLEDNLITLTNSFLTLAFEIYTNTKLTDQQIVDAFIKVMLPIDEDSAKAEWENGLLFNDRRYYAWFSTVNGMKIEENGKCEVIFIREDFKPFAAEFENLISLGKFKEIEESKEKICINKDVLSRISLGTSSCFNAGILPNIIVLPAATFPIKKDHKTLKKFKVEKDGKEKVDYELVDIHFDGDIDVFDGGGIATPTVFEQIQKELKVEYPVEFAIIRAYGLGIKGMITKFDIIGYLDSFCHTDTDFYRKVSGKYQLKDMWKKWQTVTDNTILLNESMVKLAKRFKSFEEYKERLKEVNSKYKDIIGNLYVTKINKKDKDVEDNRRLNYQILSALALSKRDYLELIREDGKAFKKILRPFVKDEKNEWKINIDAIRLFFKKIITEEKVEEVNRTVTNVVDKCDELLNVSEDFVYLKFVKNKLAKLIEKKCRELACGKVTVKAKYQYIAIDPISYMNFAMYRDQDKGENGLNAGEFYSYDCNNGDIRTIARNPLCAYSEIHNVKFKRNELLDNWLSPCRELIYFNQKSDILALMSSADTDGDACTVIDSEIIKNAVVVPKDGKYFINKDDGRKESMEYSPTNRFLATYRASGNLIGSIALKAASINSNSQQTLHYYDTTNDKFILYSDIEIENNEEKKAYAKAKLDSGEWLHINNASEQHREHIKRRFYENEKDIYIVLYNAMVSIDAPKTLYFPDKNDMAVINEKYYKKPVFLKYKENKNDVVNDEYRFSYGLLDSAVDKIQNNLLDDIEKHREEIKSKHEIIQKKLLNDDYSIEKYAACSKSIEELYTAYNTERNLVEKEFNRKKYIRDKNKRELELDQLWDQDDEDKYKSTIRKFKDEKTKAYKAIDAKYILLADDVFEQFDKPTVAQAVANMKNCTEDFIINLFFPLFEYLNEKLKPTRYIYVKSANGDIEYLYERYKKIPVEDIGNSGIVKALHNEEKKRLKLTVDIKTNMRFRIMDQSVVLLIESEIKDNECAPFDVKGNKLLRDGKVMLQAFNDADNTQIGNYSLSMCRSIKFDKLEKVNKSSIELVINQIQL